MTLRRKLMTIGAGVAQRREHRSAIWHGGDLVDRQAMVAAQLDDAVTRRGLGRAVLGPGRASMKNSSRPARKSRTRVRMVWTL
jgi:hypothetical protein